MHCALSWICTEDDMLPCNRSTGPDAEDDLSRSRSELEPVSNARFVQQ